MLREFNISAYPLPKSNMPVTAVGKAGSKNRRWRTSDLVLAVNARITVGMVEILLIAAVSLVVLVPLWKERRSTTRLEELRAGAPEEYFEERRSLEAYPPKWGWLPRLVGAVFVINYATDFVMKYAP